MGIFDFIGNAAKNLTSDIKGGLDLLSAAGSHPIKSTIGLVNLATNPIKGATQLNNLVLQTKQEGALKTITNTVINTGTAAAGLLSLGAATGSGGVIGSVGSAINSAVAKKPLLLAAPVVTSFASNVITSSPKVQEQISQVNPSQFGSDIGDLIEQPSLSNLKEVAVNNPVLTTVTAGAGALALGTVAGSIAGGLINFSNTQAIKENTKATLSNNITSSSSYPIVNSGWTEEIRTPIKPIETATTSVVSAPIGTIGEKTTKKKKKKVVKNKKVTKKKTKKKKKTTKKKVYKKKKTIKSKKKKKKR